MLNKFFKYDISILIFKIQWTKEKYFLSTLFFSFSGDLYCIVKQSSIRMEQRKHSSLTYTQTESQKKVKLMFVLVYPDYCNDSRLQDEPKVSSPTLFGAAWMTLFILGSCTLVFESARSSLTWLLTTFWGGAGDGWQSLWFKFLSVVGDNEFNLQVYGTFLLTNIIYWTVGGIYSYFDITGTPKFLRKFKVWRSGSFLTSKLT